MKGILIDVKNGTVTDVIYNGKKTLEEWYRLIGCSTVEVAMDILPNKRDKITNSIMVDEEGLLNVTPNSKFFMFQGGHQPFAGNGLIVGCDDEGETVDVSITADDVRGKVKFVNAMEAWRMSS